jgi:tripartite-type tricarboxylate transporter receptor subunit TctC
MQALLAGSMIGPSPPDQGLPQSTLAHRAYAITAKTRMAQAPNVPTTDEAGLPDFYLSYWHGLWAPKATPKEIVGKLNAAVIAALAEPAVHTRLTELGQEIFPANQQTPQTLGALHKAEVEKWWPLIKAAGIKPE